LTYLTPAALVAPFTSYTVEQSRLQARLIEKNVRIFANQYLSRREGSTCTVTCAFTGNETSVAAASVVPVTSREPSESLWQALKAAPLSTLRRIGDARAPGLIAHAVHDGHRAAREHLSPTSAPLRERVILA
jgi:dimethylamine/trimethylamine dehydrogenase